jgi:hypothetical protein
MLAYLTSIFGHYSNIIYLLITAIIFLILVILVTIVMCLRSRRRPQHRGFSKIRFDDDEDDDLNNVPLKSKLLNDEYYDASSDDENVHELYNKNSLRH